MDYHVLLHHVVLIFECKYWRILLSTKETVAAAVHIADRAVDTADARALSHALSAARSVLHCAAVSAALAVAARTFSRRCADVRLNYSALF